MSMSQSTPRFSSQMNAGEEHLPGLFVSFASLAFVLVLLSIAVSVHLSPPENPALQFGEQGLNTALTSLFVAMGGMASALVFYIRVKVFDYGALFWLMIALVCVFFSIEDRLATDAAVYAGLQGGWRGVVGWSMAVAVFLGLFCREIRACRTFLVLFAAAIAFIALNGVTNVMTSTTAGWSKILADSLGLIGVFFLFLSISARLVLLIEDLSARRRFG